VRKENETSFRNELHAHELTGYPCIVTYSFPPNALDGYYYVQEWIEGETAASAIQTMNEHEKAQFAFDFWENTAKLHSITSEYFSEDILGEKQYPSWKELYEKRVAAFLEANYAAGILSKIILKQAEHKISSLLSSLSLPILPSFTHRDIYLHNILVHNNRFQAIIDLEGAKFYDPYFDFVKPEIWIFRDHPGLRNPFHEGYTSIAPLSPETTSRYSLCSGLEYLGSIPYFTTAQPNPAMQHLFIELIQEWLKK
jgi:aminoglycoside phosphotransferase (APT) family kinase protein